MFGSRIGLKPLAQVCRSLSTLLHSGVGVKQAFTLAATKTFDPRCRRAMSGVVEGISRGEEIATAMRAQHRAFPDLLTDMVHVAEQTGALPEILEGLADHYENNLRLRKAFLSSIAWPVIQLVVAILVIALAIWIIGMIGESRVGETPDMLGLGLHGGRGALIWLVCTFGPLIGIVGAYLLISSSLAGKRFLDPLLMKIPVVGHCMRSFAIARFSWAFYLTQQTGMPITKSLDASLRATANGAFIDASRPIREAIKSGESLTDALSVGKLFGPDFLHMVDVAETSGTVPETLHRLSPQFEDQARRSLSALTTALGWAIWLLVAGFIIFLIFRVFMQYVGMIQDLANEPF